jgi:CHAT domain-containing protein/tetratricopeptide (TPR) repeat protein
MEKDIEAVTTAMQLVENGRHGDAKLLLLSVRRELSDWPDDVLGFQATRALARCFRAEHDFPAARAACGRALDIARSIGHPPAEAIALEGLAMIEAEDGRVRMAGQYFAATAEVEGRFGNLDGRGAALSNYANILINRDMEGAEQLLREALENLSPDSKYYPSAVDNLAGELLRQGRYLEAVPYSEQAVAGFVASRRSYDAYLSLRTLARVLAAADRKAESAEAFGRAHDLIRDLRREEVVESHYSTYPERVKAIEARTYEMFKGQPGELSDKMLALLAEHHIEADAAELKISLHAYQGNKLTSQGMEQLEAGQYSAAIDSFTEARAHWQDLEALHSLVTVDCHLAYAFTEIGDKERAAPLAFGARAMAHMLGDARGETMALSILANLAESLAGHDNLDYLLQARALEPLKWRQMGLADDIDPPTDGTLAAQLANVCENAGAFDLAESYHEEALKVARLTPQFLGFRVIYRLFNYQSMLRRAERMERADEIVAELRAAASAMPADPRIDRTLAQVNRRAALARGEHTPEVLAGLLEECSAYERERGQARGLDLVGFAEARKPPYEEAARVALALDDISLALGLLELGKARTLLETLGREGPHTAPSELAAARPPDIGGDVSIALLAGRATITLLRMDGASGELTCTQVDDDSEAGHELPEVVRTFVDAADAERHGDDSVIALDAVLAHPAFRLLGDALAEATPAGRTAWLVPHSYLHRAPLQLLGLAAGVGARYSVVPSMSVISALPATRRSQGRTGIAVCGDSLGDLPFARAEARLIAGRHGTVAVGGECTTEWLRSALTPSTGVLHLACHGRYDGVRPSRSGLILAAPPEEQLAGTSAAELLTLPEVARLPLDGMCVVLSACSSGMETIRTGDEASGLVSALLAAQASTVIAAQWPISDLSAMLLMTRFHHKLAEQAGSADLLAMMESAAAEVRELTAADLIETGFETAEQIVTLGGTHPEALEVAGRSLGYAFFALGDRYSVKLVSEATESPPDDDSRLAVLRALRPSPAIAAAVRPFAHPRHWGAFKVVGRVSSAVNLPAPEGRPR